MSEGIPIARLELLGHGDVSFIRVSWRPRDACECWQSSMINGVRRFDSGRLTSTTATIYTSKVGFRSSNDDVWRPRRVQLLEIAFDKYALYPSPTAFVSMSATGHNNNLLRP